MPRVRIPTAGLLAAVLASTLPMTPATAQGNPDKGPPAQAQGKVATSGTDRGAKGGSHRFSSNDRTKVMDWVRSHYPDWEPGSRQGLPPGLQKKLARGGSLPPGWEKKVRPGYRLTAQEYEAAPRVPDELRVHLPVDDEVAELIWAGDRIASIVRATREVIDVLHL